MINQELFLELLDKLQLTKNYTLCESAIPVWKEYLDKEVLQDEDYTLGIEKCIKETKGFPTLDILIEKCREARSERINRENERLRREDEKYKNLSQKDIFDRGIKQGTPLVKEMIHNLYDRLNEVIDKESFWKRHKEFEKRLSKC